MSDLRLTWDVWAADLQIEANDIVLDDGLETAVILSLFTDRRADAGDTLLDGDPDRRGWWADEYAAIARDRIGSRLWLLSREKQRTVVLERAREYAREALQWLITDLIAASVDVLVEFTRPGVLGLGIVIQRPAAAPAAYQFDYVWAAQEARG